MKKKKGEHTGLASEMGAMIPAAVGAMKMIIARNRKAEVWIEFRPSLLHKYPGAGFLWSGYEIIQTQFPEMGHMLNDMIKVSKEIQDNARGENVAKSLFR